MKVRRPSSNTAFVPGSGQPHGGRQEINNFLRALSSYPDQFARNPYVSFEEHFTAVATGVGVSSHKSAA